MRHFTITLMLFVAALTACGQEQQHATQQNAAAANATPPAELNVPAGKYRLDPHHATLQFKVKHMGLSDYIMRFMKYDIQLSLDPAHPDKSSVFVTIDPTSVRTDYQGDFKATHKDSPYNTWAERLAREPKYLDGDKFPSITFRSTKVEKTDGRFSITGDLAFLGQIHPVTLEARVTGSTDKHPFTQRGAVGFFATTTFNRSQWGQTGSQQFVSDAVTIEFNGEFQHTDPQQPASAPAS